MTAKAFRFLLRPDLVIVQPVVGPAKAKADCPAAVLRRAKEMDSRRAVAAVSFAVRFLPETGLFAVVLFCLCRCPICLATAGFVPAADPFDPAGSGFAAAAVVVVVVAAADLSVVAVDPGSGGPGVVAVAADLACSAYFSAAELGKEKAVALAFCFLTRRSSF